MTIGTGAQVQIGADTPPVYSAWVTSHANIWDNPRAVNGGAAFGAVTNGTGSYITSFSGPVTTARRYTCSTSGAAARIVTLGLGLTTPAVGSPVRVMMHIRITGGSLNTARVAVRPSDVGSATGELGLSLGSLAAGEHYIDVSGITTATAAASAGGVTLIGTPSAVSMTVDATEILVNGTGYTGGYIDGSMGAQGSLSQIIWAGTANSSDSLLQNRSVVSDGAAAKWNVGDYTIVEDSTPVDPSDTTGGFGQINITLPEDSDTRGLMNQTLILTDGAMGETQGTIRQLAGDGLSAQVTANSRIAQLAVERTIQPFIGTLTDCLEYHLDLCGITTGIVIDAGFAAVNVQVPGGRENVYDRLNRMGSVYGFEMSLVSNNIVFRAPRGRVAVNYRNATAEWTLDQNELARSVIAWVYNTTSGTSIAYPVQGDALEADVYQVDAGETKVYEVAMDASLSSVTQPTCVSYVSETDMSASVYTVSSMSTTEGVAMSPTQWLSYGGFVKVEIGEDTKTLIITIRGADLPELGPFRIAMPYGNKDFYSSLRVRGDGVFWRKERFDMIIGEDADLAPDEIGVELDIPFMEDFEKMYHSLLWTAERFSNDTQILRISTAGINRLGEDGSARYATIGDVAAAYPGATIGSIFSSLGPTIADWNAGTLALVSGDFANQAFGNVAGARVFYKNSYYRIRSASIGPRKITYTAQRDNTIGDAYHYGETIGQWNARHAGKTIRDVNIAPLKEEDVL